MAALIAKTLVGEVRRTWRAIAISTIIRRFNQWAVNKLREKESDKTKRDKIKRVSEGKRVAMFSEFMDGFLKDAREARDATTPAEYMMVFKCIEKADKKVSAQELKKLKDGFEKGLQSSAFFNPYAAELVSGYKLTAAMNGSIKFSTLRKNKKNKNDPNERPGDEPILNAELEARNVTEQMKDFIEEFGEGVDLKDVLWTKKKYYLKLHEVRENMRGNTMLNQDEAMKKCTEFKPQSKEAKDLLDLLVNAAKDNEEAKEEEKEEEEKVEEQP